MTALLIRLLVYVIIFAMIYFGLRRIWRDWTGHFRSVDQARHQRDLRERGSPDVIELKRGRDGVYRPPSDGERS